MFRQQQPAGYLQADVDQAQALGLQILNAKLCHLLPVTRKADVNCAQSNSVATTMGDRTERQTSPKAQFNIELTLLFVTGYVDGFTLNHLEAIRHGYPSVSDNRPLDHEPHEHLDKTRWY